MSVWIWHKDALIQYARFVLALILIKRIRSWHGHFTLKLNSVTHIKITFCHMCWNCRYGLTVVHETDNLWKIRLLWLHLLLLQPSARIHCAGIKTTGQGQEECLMERQSLLVLTPRAALCMRSLGQADKQPSNEKNCSSLLCQQQLTGKKQNKTGDLAYHNVWERGHFISCSCFFLTLKKLNKTKWPTKKEEWIK